MKIGIDFGNVIAGGSGEDSDMFFRDDWIETPEINDAFLSIAELAKTHELFVISKCGAKIQERSLGWMQAHRFHEITGIAVKDVFFVRTRRNKAPLAFRLGLDVFIDDRDDVLNYMKRGLFAMEYPILFTSWADTMSQISKIERFGKVF